MNKEPIAKAMGFFVHKLKSEKGIIQELKY